MASKIYFTILLCLFLCMVFGFVRADDDGNDLISGVEGMEFDTNAETELTDEEKEADEQKAKKKKKSTQDWGQLNFRELDKEWQDGDEEYELAHEAELIRQEKQRRLGNVDPRNINVNQLAEMLKLQDDSPAGKLMFCDLVLHNPKGKKWHPKEVRQLAIKFQDLLTSGGLSVWIDVGPNERLIVHVNKPWETIEVRLFLLRQPEISRILFNGDEFYPEDYQERPEPDEL